MVVKVFLVVAASAVVCVLSAGPSLMSLPIMPVLLSLGEHKFRVGAYFTVPCFLAVQNENVTFHWEKDGKPFLINGNDVKIESNGSLRGTLILKSPKDSDEGVYRCFANSTEGTASSRPIHVKKAFIEIPKYTLQKHTPEEGKPYKIACSVSKGYPKPAIEWAKRGKNSEFLKIPERMVVSPDGDLYFSNVTKEDISKDAKYVCRVYTPALTSLADVGEHIIEAVTPPKTPNNGELTPQYLSKDMVVKTGDTYVKMYCIYGGTPMAQTDWFKIFPNGTRVRMNGVIGDPVVRDEAGRRLRISKVLAEDAATYECVANNSVGKPQSHKIKFTVEQSVEFVKRSRPVVLGIKGQDVTVDCQMLAADNVTWTFNGKPYEGKTTKDGLTLTKVQKKDNGYYGCLGSNKLGDLYTETLVHVE